MKASNKCKEATTMIDAYLRPVRSLPARLTTAVLNTKLENIVNRPAKPKTYKYHTAWSSSMTFMTELYYDIYE